ncbi:uncharacterized protein LOC131953288 [Physella acuta]|uniref:uncharacterized protein LOC131953288 n=1 Tax=Physella acuta TaxID=109671 RepID=UPI0027DE142D|nr:uncharacterized protein LOC131953288 [Physella acuta]
MAHKTDVLRVLILYKFGGIYNDNDVIWINPISEDLLRYPTVACLELSRVGDWPRVVSNGIVISKPKAPFLIHVLESYWYFRDDIWALNSVLMYYKILERYPDTIHIDKKLQIECGNENLYSCHPVWIEDSENKHQPYTIQDATAAHFTHLGYPSIFKSFADIKTKSGIGVELANRIMQSVRQTGKNYLLDDN